MAVVQIVNVLHAAELFTSKQLILCYVNFTLIFENVKTKQKSYHTYISTKRAKMKKKKTYTIKSWQSVEQWEPSQTGGCVSWLQLFEKTQYLVELNPHEHPSTMFGKCLINYLLIELMEVPTVF